MAPLPPSLLGQLHLGQARLFGLAVSDDEPMAGAAEYDLACGQRKELLVRQPHDRAGAFFGKQDSQVIHRSPAMAAGLTDHLWSVREWLLTPAHGGQG